jgi:arylsulfatase
MHPWFPSYNAAFNQMYNSVVNLGEWEGEAGRPARRTGTIDWDYLATFDLRQADSAIDYIKSHASSDKPFFMDVNFMKMHNPNNPAPQFRGRTKLGDYSDSMLELDYNIGRIMDTIRAERTPGWAPPLILGPSGRSTTSQWTPTRSMT